MSAADIPESETCSYCEAEFALPNDRPNHCDDACYYRAKGEGLLNQIDSEHTICSTCYGRVKTTTPTGTTLHVEGPDHPGAQPGPRDVTDGYQYPTERTTHGVDEYGRSETDPDRAALADRIERTRWSCRCGAVDPNDRHALIQNVDLAATIANCYRALEHLHDRGAIEHAPDLEVYAAALRTHWRDAAYAVGRAVYADTDA